MEPCGNELQDSSFLRLKRRVPLSGWGSGELGLPTPILADRDAQVKQRIQGGLKRYVGKYVGVSGLNVFRGS